MSMKFTLEDAVRVQKHVRVAMQQGLLTVSQAYEIAAEVMSGKFRQEYRPGHHVNDRNELVPIPGAVSRYVDGRPVIDIPIDAKPERPRRKLHPVSIDSLVEADAVLVWPKAMILMNPKKSASGRSQLLSQAKMTILMRRRQR